MQQLLYQNSGGKRLRWIVFTEERIVRYIVCTSAGNDRSSPISDFNSTALFTPPVFSNFGTIKLPYHELNLKRLMYLKNL